MSDSIKQNLGTGYLPDDKALELAYLTDSEAVRRYLADSSGAGKVVIDSVRLERLRYHPGASCNALFSLQVHDSASGDRSQVIIYAHALSQERFDSAVSLARGMKYVPGLLTESALVDDDHRCLFYEFPNDAALTSLSLLQDMPELRTVVERCCGEAYPWIDSDCVVERFRYKPENRFVGAIKSPQGSELFVRIERTVTVRRMKASLASLRGTVELGELVSLNVPFFCDEASGLIGMEKLPGEKLSEVLRTAESITGLKQGLTALARLHSSPGDGLHKLRYDAKIRGLVRFLSVLRSGHTGLADLALTVSNWISWEAADYSDPPTCLIHGDFHPGQILINGNMTYVVDLDRVAVGPAEADIGNFIAQLWFLNKRKRLFDGKQFEQLALETYGRESRMTLDEKRLLYWKVIGLVELAAKQYRRLKPNWPASVKDILTHACATTERPIGIS